MPDTRFIIEHKRGQKTEIAVTTRPGHDTLCIKVDDAEVDIYFDGFFALQDFVQTVRDALEKVEAPKEGKTADA